MANSNQMRTPELQAKTVALRAQLERAEEKLLKSVRKDNKKQRKSRAKAGTTTATEETIPTRGGSGLGIGNGNTQGNPKPRENITEVLNLCPVYSTPQTSVMNPVNITREKPPTCELGVGDRQEDKEAASDSTEEGSPETPKKTYAEAVTMQSIQESIASVITKIGKLEKRATTERKARKSVKSPKKERTTRKREHSSEDTSMESSSQADSHEDSRTESSDTDTEVLVKRKHKKRTKHAMPFTNAIEIGDTLPELKHKQRIVDSRIDMLANRLQRGNLAFVPTPGTPAHILARDRENLTKSLTLGKQASHIVAEMQEQIQQAEHIKGGAAADLADRMRTTAAKLGIVCQRLITDIETHRCINTRAVGAGTGGITLRDMTEAGLPQIDYTEPDHTIVDSYSHAERAADRAERAGAKQLAYIQLDKATEDNHKRKERNKEPKNDPLCYHCNKTGHKKWACKDPCHKCGKLHPTGNCAPT